MQVMKSSARIDTRRSRLSCLRWLAALFAAMVLCPSSTAPAPQVSVSNALDKPNIGVTDATHPHKGQLHVALPPSSSPYGSRAARVTLRFIDAALGKRGGASWGFTVAFTVVPTNDVNLPDDCSRLAGTPFSSALTINRGMDKDTFEAVAVLAPIQTDGATLCVTNVQAAAGDSASVPANIELRLGLQGEVLFQPAQKPSISLPGGSDTVELTSVPGAAAYEFEWTYVDEFGGPARDPVRTRSPIRRTSSIWHIPRAKLRFVVERSDQIR